MSKASISFGLAAAVAGIMMLSSASAQTIRNHDSNAPVDFAAGSMELQDRADRVVLAGGARPLRGRRCGRAGDERGGDRHHAEDAAQTPDGPLLPQVQPHVITPTVAFPEFPHSN